MSSVFTTTRKRPRRNDDPAQPEKGKASTGSGSRLLSAGARSHRLRFDGTSPGILVTDFLTSPEPSFHTYKVLIPPLSQAQHRVKETCLLLHPHSTTIPAASHFSYVLRRCVRLDAAERQLSHRVTFSNNQNTLRLSTTGGRLCSPVSFSALLPWLISPSA